MNVFTTIFVALLLLNDSNISKELYLQSSSVKDLSDEEVGQRITPNFIWTVVLMEIIIHGLLSLYVYKKRDYIAGKVTNDSNADNKNSIVNLFCVKCGKEITKGDSFCSNCGANAANSVSSPKKNKFLKHVLYIVLTLTVVAALGNFRIQQRNSEDAKIINDALKGSNTASIENKKYVNLLQQILEYNKTENEKTYPICLKLDKSELLQYSTFKTKESLQIYIDDLNGCLREYSNFEEKYDSLMRDAANKIEELMARENISEKEKQGVKKGFEESLNDKKKRNLVIKQSQALQTYYISTLKIYNFLLVNFSSYEIDYDETGEFNIYFSDGTKENEYYGILDELDVSLTDFSEADNELNSYLNGLFEKTGAGVNANDIQNFMQK